MATRRTRSPYMMSANLGSGARTTTGGTYENPRLGIQDYTAFGRGVASTLRAPEQGEVEELQGFNTAFELGKNDFLKDIDGTTYSLEANPLVNINWQNSELAQLQNQYQKANARDRQRIQNHILGYKAAIGADENSSFSKYLKYVSDPDVYDSNVSNKFLPGVDGKNSNLTIAQFAKINSENPNAVRISSKTNRFGIPQYGFEVNGQFVNASAMTDQWLTDNFNVKADLGLDVQKSVASGGSAMRYTSVKPTYNSDGSSVSVTLPGGAQVETTKNATKYIRDDWYKDTDEFASKFAVNRYSSENDAIYESAWNQLTNKYKDGSFKPSSQLMQQLGVEDAKEIANLRLSDQDKIALLQDQAMEEFKIVNGNVGYIRGGDGRALSRNVVQYQNDVVTKDGPDKDNSMAGNSLYESFKALVDTQAFEGATGEVFTKKTVDPAKFVNLMNKSSKSGDFYFTREQLTSNKNQIRDQWIASTNADLKPNEDPVTADDFNRAVQGTVGGAGNILFRIPAEGGKFKPVAGFDGTILGAMGAYARDAFGSTVDQARAINYAQSLFLEGGDVSRVQDPFQPTGEFRDRSIITTLPPSIPTIKPTASAGDPLQTINKTYANQS